MLTWQKEYTSDKEYEEGTIMCIGGHAETTICVEGIVQSNWCCIRN